MFEFEKNERFTCGRSNFANYVCKLIYQKHCGDLHLAFDDIEKVHNYFYDHVRNIYELVDHSIPMFAYYELIKHGKENYSFTQEEYDAAIEKTKEACKLYYSN